MSEVADEPGGFIGERVTLFREVGNLFFLRPAAGGTGGGDQGGQTGAQNLGGLAFTFADERLLVVSAGDEGAFLDQDSVVQVTGTVRRFDVQGFADDFGWFFEHPFFGEFEGPALVASSIDPTAPEDDGGSTG